MTRFPFAFETRYSWLLRPFGVSADNSAVTVTDDELQVAFGRFRVQTRLDNIAGIERSGGYRFWKAIGLRGSMVDSGITFGTTTEAGVCIKFIEKIPPVIPYPKSGHRGMTVTVADPDGLVAALAERGVPV